MARVWPYVIGLAAVAATVVATTLWAANADDPAKSAEKRAKWHGEGGFHRADPAQILKEHPEADTDGNGTLSKEEMQAFMQLRMEDRKKELLQRHPELDADKDGVLNEQEMKVAREKYPWLAGDWQEFRPPVVFFDWLTDHFTEGDVDGNGQLSKDELAKLKEKYAVQGKGPFGPGPGDRGAFREEVLKSFPNADTDGDGKLSDEELKALGPQHGGTGEKAKVKGAGHGSHEKSPKAKPETE